MRQTGGRGQYGHVQDPPEPLQPGDGLRVRERDHRRRDSEGVHQADRAGHQGSAGARRPRRLSRWSTSRSAVRRLYHEVDSSEMAFKIAGSMAFKEAAKKAKPVLLEPMMSVEVVVPEEYMGAVIGDLTRAAAGSKRMEDRGGTQIIKSHGAAVGDVRLRHRAALAHAGPRALTPCTSSATKKCRATSPKKSSPRCRAQGK